MAASACSRSSRIFHSPGFSNLTHFLNLYCTQYYGVKLWTVIGFRLKISVCPTVDGKPFNKNCSRCVRYVCNINRAQLTQYKHTLKVIKFETSCAHTKLDLCFLLKLLNALIDCLVIMNFLANPRQIQLNFFLFADLNLTSKVTLMFISWPIIRYFRKTPTFSLFPTCVHR